MSCQYESLTKGIINSYTLTLLLKTMGKVGGGVYL